MKKYMLLTILFCSSLFGHSLLMNVMDNEDNTITIAGEFTTGQLAPGAMLRLESLVNGTILFKQRLPESSELTVEIPKEPYQIVLDGGPSHQVVEKGIPPQEGFKKEALNKALVNSSTLSQPRSTTNEWNNSTVILFILAFILIGFTIYFSRLNTNKILAQIKQKD
ncbi:hypothetical protein [Halarcobacter ebronensis]|nr:hypothetical protein [Halarcobacter ebronensis]